MGATPAQDAATGFSVAWRTNSAVKEPVLEIVVAGDSPDMREPRRVQASTQALSTENGIAHQHRVDDDRLSPDTLYAWRVQGAGILWPPWCQLRNAGAPGQALVWPSLHGPHNRHPSPQLQMTSHPTPPLPPT